MKKEFVVEREGRSFVLYAGLLDEAHQQGLKSIQTTLLQVPNDDNGYTAICQAIVETEKGIYSGIGDASPDNVTRIMRQHLIRMSETRAKARALRDAVNVGVAALEELGEEFDHVDTETTPSDRPERPAPAARPRPQQQSGGQAQQRTQSNEPATPAQVNAMYAIGRREFHWSEEDMDARSRAQYGKAVADLTKREASEFIDKLKTNPSSVA